MTARQLRDICQRLDIWITYHPLPGARGMSTKTQNGYTVVICDTLSQEAKERALLHEVAHIALHHHDSRKHLTVSQKEQEVDRLISRSERGQIWPVA